MTNTELLFDGEGLCVYRLTRNGKVFMDIVKLASSESLQLTQEQVRAILPNLQGFAASSFGEEGNIS